MNRILWLAFFMLGIHNTGLNAQTIFSEPFDEANGSTTGVDNTAGVSWSVVCPGCISGDYFNVQSGALQCDDTNGPATWTSGTINTSACTGNIQISMDISTSSATNAFEECVSGCGCNCVDWIMIEYSLNGGGFVSATSSEGGTCTEGCSGGSYAVLGALTSSPFAFTYCIPSTGTSLVLRVSVQTWAQGEIYRIDNITAQCMNCVLPVEITHFEAKNNNTVNELNWTTQTETESSYFTIEKAADDGKFSPIDSIDAAGYSAQPRDYVYIDYNPLSGINYYRLKQTDKNGSTYYSAITVVENESQNVINAQYNPGQLILYGCYANESVTLYDYSGRVLGVFTCTKQQETLYMVLPPGIYMIRSGFDQKDRHTRFFVY
jgi:hypothetical protein